MLRFAAAEISGGMHKEGQLCQFENGGQYARLQDTSNLHVFVFVFVSDAQIQEGQSGS